MWLRLKENDGDQVREIEAFLAQQNLSFEKMDLAKEILYRLDLGSKSLENLEFPASVDVLPGENPYPLVSLEAKPERTRIVCGAHEIGPQKLTLIAGPCAVETPEQIQASAALVAKAGGHILRGGVFKPRTSPYAFQGLGAEGYPLLAQAARAHGLLSVSEVMDVEQIPQAAEYIDILQIGSRNMQNYSLLKALSKVQKPVLLKRGSAATLEEFLLSAEYILAGGNESVILCERGIRTFSAHQRHTFDVAIIPELKARTHLPVFADPSHATGKASMVAPMAKAALAAGADGIMVEAHPAPEHALSDAAQSLTGEGLHKLGDELFALESFLQS
ncbi:MAG: 3-deoxy-7-phosphoheptulonate synthase [Myxococcales bacterium]|nr:3-deoxy-7-phosphoheptulonate synthase [Myxococcales bacterium]|tara:strand:+ start:325 stop:1320 length:996 start_codon:yes stop_codon:yes gene_type:complete